MFLIFYPIDIHTSSKLPIHAIIELSKVVYVVNIDNFEKLAMSEIMNIAKQSNLQFNTDGQMFFDDNLYLTEWNFSQEYFKSRTLFHTVQSESFVVEEPNSIEAMNWNHFGFVQDFYNPTTGDIFSPFHRNSHFELYYVAEGSFRIKLQDKFLELQAGDMLFINQYVNHSDIISFKPLKLFILGLNNVCFNDYFFKKVNHPKLHNLIKRSLQSNYNISEYIAFNAKDGLDDLNNLFSSLATELALKNIAYEKIVVATLLRIIQMTKASPIISEFTGITLGRKSLIFDEVDRYMKYHYAQMNLDDLANYMCFSKDYFNRLIKEITGLTYMEYLQKIRMDEAKRLLVSSDKVIDGISTQIGYKNLSHFYKVFKEQTGITPKEYRNRAIVIDNGR